MTRTLDPTAETTREAALEALVAGLRNAHALEKQAVAVLESQLDRMQDYPDLHARITSHALESREHGRRIEGALDVCDASTSVVKDVMMSVMGLGQSSVQGFADDAVLKAVLADSMFEHLEIASYRSLIELAELAGKPELRPRLEETLHEEEAMAAWLDENLPAITRRYVEISAGELEAEKNPPKGARNPKDGAKADPGSDLAAVQKETLAREARARKANDRAAMGAGAQSGDGHAPSGGGAGGARSADGDNSSGGSLGMTPENPKSERAGSAMPGAVRDA